MGNGAQKTFLITLPFLNCEQLPHTKCQMAATVPGEFTKLVYDSKFTKLAM